MILAWRNRCSAQLWMHPHETIFKLRRDRDGNPEVPCVIIWECQRCGRDVGETRLKQSWSLIAKLRRQVTTLKQKRKRA